MTNLAHVILLRRHGLTYQTIDIASLCSAFKMSTLISIFQFNFFQFLASLQVNFTFQSLTLFNFIFLCESTHFVVSHFLSYIVFYFQSTWLISIFFFLRIGFSRMHINTLTHFFYLNDSFFIFFAWNTKIFFYRGFFLRCLKYNILLMRTEISSTLFIENLNWRFIHLSLICALSIQAWSGKIFFFFLFLILFQLAARNLCIWIIQINACFIC